MKPVALLSPVPRTKPFVMLYSNPNFVISDHCYVTLVFLFFFMISVALLSPVPRTKPFVSANI
jgi:hypothetical protein